MARSEGRGRRALEEALGSARARLTTLAAGRTGEVLRVDVDGQPPRVAKLDDTGLGGLESEGASLALIGRAGAPAPAVLHTSPHVLLMEWCSGRTGVTAEAADSAAAALHALHAAGARPFGLDFGTCVGGLAQSNAPRASWLEFFAEERLLPFARAARDEGRLAAGAVSLVEGVAARIAELADEPSAPALLHGDLWSGNVLTDGARLTAFIDPAPYHGHPEVDLAVATMFGGFPRRFFDAYRERASDPALLDGEFWSTRRDLWNLFPLLVHVRLFGGGYADELTRSAARLA